MKRLVMFVLVVVFLAALPLMAQDMFKDVPSDHWAYDAVAKLQSSSLVQGYPGNLYIGKRNLSRYEFAMVIAKLTSWVEEKLGTTMSPAGTAVAGPAGVSIAQVNALLAGYAKSGDVAAAAAAAKADIETVKKLADAFRKDLDQLGVKVTDLDTKLSDIAAVLAAVKKEQERFRVTGTATFFAKAAGNNGKGTQPVVDADNRTAGVMDSVIRNNNTFTDIDLTMVGKVSDSTKANLTLNYGNYLSYLGGLDSYMGGSIVSGLRDGITIYNANVETSTSFGKLTVGRQPLQITPYTLKQIDVDSYTTNAKTDSGNYTFDGFKLNSTYGGVDVTSFFGRTNNAAFQAGYVTAPLTGGLFDNLFSSGGLAGSSGITSAITQEAGVHASVPTPLDGKAGLTYYRAWSAGAWTAGRLSQAEVMSFDLSLPIPFGVNLDATVGQSNVLSDDSNSKVDYRNGMYDAKLSGDIAGIGIGVGYKRIGENYIAAGNWGKIGRWSNPRMVKGVYADLKYSFGENIKLKLGGNFLQFTDSKGVITQDDKIQQICGGVEYQLSGANSIGVDVERVSYPDWATRRASADDPVETYITLGWNHKLNEDAGLKVGYQMISYDRGVGSAFPAQAPYTTDYRGGVGVVQLGVSF